MTGARALDPTVAPKSEAGRERLLLTLLIGVFAIALAAIAGSVILGLAGRDYAALAVIAAGAVTATVGLFSAATRG